MSMKCDCGYCSQLRSGATVAPAYSGITADKLAGTVAMFPKSVEILGSRFDVTVTTLGPEEDCGDSTLAARSIRIDSNIHPDTKAETFYHEVVHMMMQHLGLSELLSDEQDELFAQSLGMALAQFVQRNPNLPGSRL